MSGLPTTEKPSAGGLSLHPAFYIMCVPCPVAGPWLGNRASREAVVANSRD